MGFNSAFKGLKIKPLGTLCCGTDKERKRILYEEGVLPPVLFKSFARKVYGDL